LNASTAVAAKTIVTHEHPASFATRTLKGLGELRSMSRHLLADE
jgi:hypothetical protein